MKKKGFTLVELLAVIVILAVIAIIAVPIILNVIDKSKESSAVDSAYGYINAIENNLAIAEVKSGLIAEDKEYEDLREFEETYNVTIKGTKPESGKFTLNKRKVVSAEFKIDGYNIVCDKKKCESKGKKVTVQVTVTYNANGGTLDKTEDVVTQNATLSLPTPTKNDYSFVGWYTEANGGEEVTNETPITSELTLYAQYVKTVNNFDYTGNIQEITLSKGRYKLEAWGAQGGYYSSSLEGHGGYGGYSYGEILLNENKKLYIVIGGQGYITSGGYNGGGTVNGTGGYGGGATHIALRTGLLSALSSYQSDVLIVAGGGAGCGSLNNDYGGNGGGYIGETGNRSGYTRTSTGGTQNSGGVNSPTDGTVSGSTGTFGQGGIGLGSDGGAGGGGWYGGAGSYGANGGGGSGYIGNSLLSNKGMYMSNKVSNSNNLGCTSSNDENTKTTCTSNVSFTPTSNYAKQGNGYARITYLGK